MYICMDLFIEKKKRKQKSAEQGWRRINQSLGGGRILRLPSGIQNTTLKDRIRSQQLVDNTQKGGVEI